MAQSNGGRMLAFVQGREKARLEERARKNVSPSGNAPLSAEERARIAKDLRFPNAGRLDDRSGSPLPRHPNPHARRPADNDRAAVLPQRGTRVRSTFDSEYTESESSVNEFAGLGQPSARTLVFDTDQGVHAQQVEDAAAARYGHADALDGDAVSEDERPQSSASEFSRINRQAHKILEENRARRLQTAAMSHQDDDSYPATTSGRISTPEPFAESARARQFSPRPIQHVPVSREQSGLLQFEDDSANAHKAAYMRQSAENYQKQHAGPPADTVVLRGVGPQPASTATPRTHQVRTGAVHGLLNANKELPEVPAFQYRTTAQAAEQLPTTAIDDEAMLDYAPHSLYKMTFNALRDESFDFDPSAKDESASATEDASLPNRLTAAIDFDKSARRDLLKSIPQSDWDAVDAWFSEQFADLAQQRTQKRVERRAIAREFEEQVAQRFAEVDGEREELKRALGDMKQSGANVLKVGTPTPKRKHAAA